MKMMPFFGAAWRRLPLSAANKRTLKLWLLRRWPSLQRPMFPALVASNVESEQPIGFTAGSPQPAWRSTHSEDRDWLVFSIIGWDFRVQRPQHLTRELSRTGAAAFYIEPFFIADAQAGYQIRRLDEGLPLYAVTLHLAGAPQIYFKAPTPEQQTQLRDSLGLLMRDWGIESSAAMVEHPYWASLVLSMPNTVRLYDCMDHHEGFGGMPPELLELEHLLMQRCDAVTVTSQWLHTWAGDRGVATQIVRNGCDFLHFSKRPAQTYQPEPSRPVIGYFGAIAEWFDVILVEKMARAFPHCEVLLVGADTVQAGKVLGKLPNVRMVGERPYTELPFYLHSFAVALLPFQRIPLTLATNPVKVYEYLCAGKEVVCTDLPEISQFGNLVHKAADHSAFLAAVERSLQQPGDSKTQAARKTFAQEQTWKHRAQELQTCLRRLQFPSVSVVVLTYNNWAYTEACLESLLQQTDYPGPLEIVVTDNASSDETVERLTEWATREPRMKLVLNEDNLGFSAGNNTGLAAASGDYLVMLNNDTVVTRGWLLTLLRHFQSDPTLGLLGPATNHIGNESMVPVAYRTIEEMPAAARKYTLAHMGELYPMRTLAFFCVMMPRAVYERVGPMDETFGRGFFEDDDYCRRIEQQGFHMACADDVLVHHHLSASFDKIDGSERQILFDRNKVYYESKWGAWVPHRYRPQ
jgi:GT2 family glycosyltransferase